MKLTPLVLVILFSILLVSIAITGVQAQAEDKSRTDPFWTAWAGDAQSWIRLKATADEIDTFSVEFLEQERSTLGDDTFKREYLGIPSGGRISPFTWELYERATQFHPPLLPPGPAFGPPVKERAVPIVNPFQRLKSNGELK